MRPTLRLLSPELLARILDEAFQLLARLGVRVGSSEVIDLLRSHHVEVKDGVAYIHEPLVRDCLSTVPTEFDLYNRQGEAVVHYGGNSVQFDPGSCCVQVLDPETLQARPSTTADLVRLVQVAEMLPQGIGELQLAFEQLKAKLEAEGLFAATRKRPLPALPRKIGIVTSLDGAATSAGAASSLADSLAPRPSGSSFARSGAASPSWTTVSVTSLPGSPWIILITSLIRMLSVALPSTLIIRSPAWTPAPG